MKRMMKKSVSMMLTAIGMMAMLMACGDGNKDANVAQLERQVDSLTQLTARQQGDLNDMEHFMHILSEGLDTIAKLEHSLFYTNKGREGTIVSRDQLKANLNAFASTLAEQRQRINSLTDSLKNRNGSIEKLQMLVDLVNRQLDEKDQMISQLQTELQNKNANIAGLSEKINSLNQANSSLAKKVEQQNQQITSQQEQMNAGYVVMGSNKMLKEYGIITKGGLFKRSQINNENMPTELFTKVDTRTFGGLEIPASRPRILSDVPSKSYKIVKKGKDLSELQLTDPDAFWSKTRYIVIETY